jgi:hypothetical protein
LALLLEDKLALLVVVLVLTPTPVLTTLLSLLAFPCCRGAVVRWRGWRHAMRLRGRLLPHGGGVVESVIGLGHMVGQPLAQKESVRTFPLFLGMLSGS